MGCCLEFATVDGHEQSTISFAGWEGEGPTQSANSDHWRPDRKPMTIMSHLSVFQGLGNPTIHL